MKKSRTILCLLLAAVILAAVMLSAHAVPAPMYIGDVDGDNQVTILDATRIQRWLAGLEENLVDYYGTDQPQKLQEYIGDIDGDGFCSIFDATYIQRMLVDLEPEKKEDTWAYYISPTRFYANYDSGKAMVGTPVTFTAEIPYYDLMSKDDPTMPYTYEFRINGEVVQERSDKNTLTYTFTEAGDYEVTAVFYNALDVTRSNTLGISGYAYVYPRTGYRVVEPYSLEKPVIVYADFPEDTETFTCTGPLVVRAEGGSGGYQYKVDLKDGEFIPGDGWTQTDAYTLTTGWVSDSSFTMPQSEDRVPSGNLIITARDSAGVESEPVQIQYCEDYAIE